MRYKIMKAGNHEGMKLRRVKQHFLNYMPLNCIPSYNSALLISCNNYILHSEGCTFCNK